MHHQYGDQMYYPWLIIILLHQHGTWESSALTFFTYRSTWYGNVTIMSRKCQCYDATTMASIKDYFVVNSFGHLVVKLSFILWNWDFILLQPFTSGWSPKQAGPKVNLISKMIRNIIIFKTKGNKYIKSNCLAIWHFL